MRNKLFFLLIFFILAINLIPLAHAHCPLCTVAVGAAAISAKYYGVDVSIIGLLIGAFGISTGLWIGLKVKKYFKFQLPLIVLASFLLTVIPLIYLSDEYIYAPILWFGAAGSLLNKVYWINKILFGSLIGGVVAVLAYLLHAYVKKIRGKVLFPYQGVAFTVLSLAIAGLTMYFTAGA
ncbi:MAG TPA: hypothetical protein VJJ52_04625 [Candidatus Nanoarchaeia archaeon]|nr:hypothetical protein [Candidatus Nanoarchaeia archaeon]